MIFITDLVPVLLKRDDDDDNDIPRSFQRLIL
jgi:hypothetical protein